MINEQDLVKALSVQANILHRHTPVLSVTRDVITLVIPLIPVVVALTMALLGQGQGGPTRAANNRKIRMTITSTVCMLWHAAVFIITIIIQCLITATLTLVSTVLSTLNMITNNIVMILITPIITHQPRYAG